MASDITRITSLVYSFVAVPQTAEGTELAARVINRIVDTGDCVLHAVAAVTGKACHCADCTTRR